MNSELYHYGVKNQKHGVRRYQNEDGTWTEEGKARRRYGKGNNSGSYDLVTMNDAKRMRREDIKKESLSSLDVVQKSSSNVVKSLNQTNNNNRLNYKKYESELSKMSDNDLRNIVNRMQLENNYVRLQSDRNPEVTKRGKDIVVDVLKTTGAVITVTASAVAIADGINNLMMAAKG